MTDRGTRTESGEREERKRARLEGEEGEKAKRQRCSTRPLEREGAWPWPLLRGNSVKVSADELPPAGGRRAGR